MEKQENKKQDNAAGAAASASAVKLIVKVDVLPFTGEIVLGENNGSEFIGVYMNNPFEGEPFDRTRLTFEKPDKKDRWGNSTSDRAGEERGGLFEWLSKKALKDESTIYHKTGSIPVTGEITYRRWKSKKGDVDYINISLFSPFGDIKGRSTVNAYLRSGKDDGVFEYLAKERLNITTDTSNN